MWVLTLASAPDCPFGACPARPRAAQNDASADSPTERRTGDLCVERHKHICADMARLAALIADVLCA
jgi:hypothetical protein